MKKITLLFFFFLLTFAVFAQKKKKAVFIIADGIPVDVIEKVNKPTLDAIAKVGGFAHAHVGGDKGSYSETPTISAVGYNSLLTGTWVNKHNVWDNDIKAPNYAYWTIFRFLKNKYPDKKTAIFSTWLDNRTKLVGDKFAATGNLPVDYHFDGLELDTIQYPHDKQKQYLHLIDERVATEAANYIKSEAPDLSWVYLEFTDDMGHKFGDSPQFYSAIEQMDGQVKRIWESIQYRQQHFNEDWVIYITTDHGRDPNTGKGHGGQSDRERNTWIVTNAQDLNENFQHSQPGIVDIMPSIASFLSINLPREQRFEIDGVPLTGKISAISPQANFQDGQITITWKAIEKTGKAKIWLATTNNFKTGGKDTYQLITQVPLTAEKAVFKINDKPSSLYKIVIEAPHNTLNRWVVIK